MGLWRAFKTLLLIVVLAALVIGAVLLAQDPGSIVLRWRGTELVTNVAVLLALAVALIVVLWLLFRLWRAVAGTPEKLRGWRAESRLYKGQLALTQGMVAVAAGDRDEAHRQAGRALNLLQDTPLTLLLQAQAAQLGGDDRAADRYFGRMLENPDTRFLGLRGLIGMAQNDNDTARALEYAKEAVDTKPNSPWAVTTLFDLQARSGRWSEAEKTLDLAVRRKLFEADQARGYRAVLLLEQSREAEGEGRMGEARQIARRAHGVEQARVPVVLRYARLLIAEGDLRAARKVIEKAWAERPHPDLADLYLSTVEETGERARLRALQRLARSNPEHIESRIAIAEAAIACEEWEEARVALAPVAGAAAPAARVCRLMARIEQGEHGNAGKAQAWLARVQDATPGATWVCGSCRAIRPAWTAVCDHCGAFGAIEWREAPRLSPVAATLSDAASLPPATGHRGAVAIAAGNLTLDAETGPSDRAPRSSASSSPRPQRRGEDMPPPPDIAGPRAHDEDDDEVRPPRPD